MDTTKSCANCAAWNSETADYMLGLGLCGYTPMFWDSTTWREDGEGREFVPEAAKTTAFAQDGSDYSAKLYTKPGHYCSMHVPANPVLSQDTTHEQ